MCGAENRHVALWLGSNLVQSGRQVFDQGSQPFWCESSSIKRPSSSLLDSKSSSTLISNSNSILNTFTHSQKPTSFSSNSIPKCSSPRSPPSSPWPPLPSLLPLPLPVTTRSSLALAAATTATTSPPALLRAQTFAATVSAASSRSLAPVAPPALTAASLMPLWQL